MADFEEELSDLIGEVQNLGNTVSQFTDEYLEADDVKLKDILEAFGTIAGVVNRRVIEIIDMTDGLRTSWRKLQKVADAAADDADKAEPDALCFRTLRDGMEGVRLYTRDVQYHAEGPYRGDGDSSPGVERELQKILSLREIQAFDRGVQSERSAIKEMAEMAAKVVLGDDK